MFWFDKNRRDVVYGDIRIHNKELLCDNRWLEIRPEIQIDFRCLPFKKSTFKMVVFDPPHLQSAGPKSFMAKKYGKLFDTWRDDIRDGFREAFRVLVSDGTLIFKWNESQIPIGDILSLTDQTPLFGNRSGRLSKTHWLCFMKRTGN